MEEGRKITPQVQASDMPPTRSPPCADGEREATHVMHVIRQICSRLPARSEVGKFRERGEPGALAKFLSSLGPRHRDARLENFQPPNAEAGEAVRRLKAYADRIAWHVAAGTGIVLYGPSGTGKDHLLVALAKVAIRHGHNVKRITGAELFRMMRDAMSAGEECRRLERLKYGSVLILSDPLPPLGSLTPYQASVLYEIVDYRWQQRLPIWCSLNVANAQEADARIGASIVDRLQQEALVLKCNWPSYRRPAQMVTDDENATQGLGACFHDSTKETPNGSES